MSNDVTATSVNAGRASAVLRSALNQLPMGGLERQAVEAGEIDAIIDYTSSNVIVFPAARRVLRDIARRAAETARKAKLEMPERNSLLATLPRVEYRRLLPCLEHVELEAGDVLQDVNVPVRHVYFPVDSVVCLMTRIDNQRSIATGLVGPEGMVGMSLALEVGSSSVRAVVEVAGTALRLPAARFTGELQRGLQLQRQLYRYAQAKLNQARQIAACIGAYHFEQRLAGWLLMISDRARSPELLLTHEHLAATLNVRRESVTSASTSLRSRGLISYNRGKILILDRNGLASAACGCYRSIEVADLA